MTSNYFMADLIEETLSTKMDFDWSDISLYVSLQKQQALLYEYAECLAARAFLKMADLQFRLEERHNAEYMSPNGKLPFLRLKGTDNKEALFPEFLCIVDAVSKKGIRLSTGLVGSERSDMRAHIAVIEQLLKNAEIFITWADQKTYSQVTKQRYGSAFSWPLSLLLPAFKRKEVLSYLNAIGWGKMSIDQVLDFADRCFKSLSARLDKNMYFMGDLPTELDALAFGHLYTILTTEIPNMGLVNSLRKFSNLIEFCRRIEKQYFSYS
uniref:Metaxin n=1 Tax=Syphacia muris TaxID=451379 RepID=A0A0N5AGF5_9BILA